LASAQEAGEYEAAWGSLHGGGIVALPTDTVYGLCARAGDPAAVERIYAIKQRDPSQAMPIFVASRAQSETIGMMNDAARILAAAFWPGALTIVVRKQPSYDSRALAGGDTVALRVPGDERLRRLCEEVGPLTGTSANIAGREECHTAAEVRAQLGDAGAPGVDLIVDAAVDAAGRPSTIVDCTQDPPAILRHGAIAEEQIRAVLRG
jgi:L-threonylcarbamoyladenylate synthase